jgi:hypothetical protein
MGVEDGGYYYMNSTGSEFRTSISTNTRPEPDWTTGALIAQDQIVPATRGIRRERGVHICTILCIQPSGATVRDRVPTGEYSVYYTAFSSLSHCPPSLSSLAAADTAFLLEAQRYLETFFLRKSRTAVPHGTESHGGRDYMRASQTGLLVHGGRGHIRRRSAGPTAARPIRPA